MWVIAGVLATAGICAVIEIPSLIGHKKDLWVFSVILVLATVLCSAAALRLPVPNPLDGIAAIFRPVGTWMQSLFK